MKVYHNCKDKLFLLAHFLLLSLVLYYHVHVEDSWNSNALYNRRVLYDDIETRRRLAENGKFLPEPDRYFEFPGKKVPNVTSKELPKLYQVKLKDKISVCNFTNYEYELVLEIVDEKVE